MPDATNPFQDAALPQETISGNEIINGERTTYQQINQIGGEGSLRIPIKTVSNRFGPNGNVVTETVDHQTFDRDGRLLHKKITGRSHEGFLITEDDLSGYCQSWLHPDQDRLVKDGSDGRVLPDGTARCRTCLQIQNNVTLALVVCGTALILGLIIGIFKCIRLL